MSDRTTKAGVAVGPPQKPFPDFPLFAHATGYWAKKVRGRLVYFGRWDDPDGAVQRWRAEKDDLLAGRTPGHTPATNVTLRDLVNAFLTTKRHAVDAGDIVERTWHDYHKTCSRLLAALGKHRAVSDLMPRDFELYRGSLVKGTKSKARDNQRKGWGPTSVGNEVQRVRVLFKYGYDAGLLERPMRFGQGFKRPAKKVLRQVRQAKGLRMFEPADIRRMLQVAGTPMRAMILLGINCGLGNADCAALPLSALDLEKGWLDFPRPKTAVQRRCPLWPETIAELKAAIAARPTPRTTEDERYLFVTKYGAAWGKSYVDSPISKEMAKILQKLGLKRPGLNFYALRHTFETIGGESRDQVAVDHIMGHAPHAGDMSAVYRERISDARLIAVVEHVRGWLLR